MSRLRRSGDPLATLDSRPAMTRVGIPLDGPRVTESGAEYVNS